MRLVLRGTPVVYSECVALVFRFCSTGYGSMEIPGLCLIYSNLLRLSDGYFD